MFALFVILLIVGVGLYLGAVLGKDEFSSETTPKVMKYCGYGSGVLALMFFIFSCLYIVNPGEVGVEVLFGKIQRYSENGMRWRNPLSSVEIFDIKTLRSDYKSEGMSQDMQVVNLETVINYRIDYTRIADLYTKVGRDYEEKIIVPALQQTLKETCSKYKVEEITVNREKLKAVAEAELMSKLSNFYIVLQDLNIVDIDFSPEFNRVVEEKQLEEQKIKTAEYVKKQAEQNKLTTILQAQAEAEKQRLLRETTSKEVIELKRIEKWDGHYPTVMGGNNIIGMKIPGLSETSGQ